MLSMKTDGSWGSESRKKCTME